MVILKQKINKTALHIAIEKDNIDVVRLLLNNKNIDICIKQINIYLF